MKKTFIAGIVTGAVAFGTVSAMSQVIMYQATKNTFPIKLNGSDVSMEGYNIDGYTYFKLRDIADVTGEFEVGFEDNTIQLSKDGYKYENKPQSTDWKNMLGEYDYDGEYLNSIYISSKNGEPYLDIATYRGGDDLSGGLFVNDDGSLFWSNGGTRSFTLRFVDDKTIELTGDTWESQLEGIYKKQ